MTTNRAFDFKIDTWSVVLVILLVSSVYFPAIHGTFVYDDHETITKNPYIKDLRLIPAYFNPTKVATWSVHPGQQQFYRPLPLVSFAINYRLAGLSPEIYHVTNVILHITASLLLYALILSTYRAMTPDMEFNRHYKAAALFSVLAFALHPIQTESVTYIVSRSVVICSIFILAGLLCHLESIKKRGKKRTGWRILAVACFVLALLSKEIAIVFPLLLISLSWSFAKSNNYKTPVRFICSQGLLYFIFLALYLAIRITFLGQATMTNIGRQSFFYFLTASKALFVYLRLIFLPIGQNIDHHLPIADSFGDPVGLIAAILVTFFFTLVMKTLLRTPGFHAFWFSWFFLSILPNLVLSSREAISEHSTYLPSMGLITIFIFAFIQTAIKRWPFSNRSCLALLLGIAIISLFQLSFLSLHRNLVWRNPIALWNDAVIKNPHSSRAMINLGIAYLERDQILKAQRHFLQAIALQKDSVEARNNLGTIYGLQRKPVQAEKLFREALALDPAHIDSLNNLGFLYMQDKAYHKAIETLSSARDISPNNPNIMCNLGLAYVHLKETEKGCLLIQESIRLNPDSPRALSLMKEYCR